MATPRDGGANLPNVPLPILYQAPKRGCMIVGADPTSPRSDNPAGDEGSASPAALRFDSPDDGRLASKSLGRPVYSICCVTRVLGVSALWGVV